MVKDTLKMLDELSAAIERARKRREPEHVASLKALDAMATAVTATRGYAESDLVLIDGSRGAARLGEIGKLWKAARREVAALPTEGKEHALLKSEGWHKRDRWEKLESQGGWLWMKELLAHCEWLLSVLPAAGKR